MLRGIRRCMAADRDLSDEPSEISALELPFSSNLSGSLPEPLDFAFDTPFSVSNDSETPGIGYADVIQKEATCEHEARHRDLP